MSAADLFTRHRAAVGTTHGEVGRQGGGDGGGKKPTGGHGRPGPQGGVSEREKELENTKRSRQQITQSYCDLTESDDKKLSYRHITKAEARALSGLPPIVTQYADLGRYASEGANARLDDDSRSTTHSAASHEGRGHDRRNRDNTPETTNPRTPLADARTRLLQGVLQMKSEGQSEPWRLKKSGRMMTIGRTEVDLAVGKIELAGEGEEPRTEDREVQAPGEATGEDDSGRITSGLNLVLPFALMLVGA